MGIIGTVTTAGFYWLSLSCHPQPRLIVTSFICSLQNRTKLFKCSQCNGSRCCGSGAGWLVLDEEKDRKLVLF